MKKDNTCDSAKVILTPQFIFINEWEKFKINIEYEASEDQNIYIPVIEFESDNRNIADVDEEGIIYGIAKGTYRRKRMYNNNYLL